jgi:hypothetical protein
MKWRRPARSAVSDAMMKDLAPSCARRPKMAQHVAFQTSICLPARMHPEQKINHITFDVAAAHTEQESFQSPGAVYKVVCTVRSNPACVVARQVSAQFFCFIHQLPSIFCDLLTLTKINLCCVFALLCRYHIHLLPENKTARSFVFIEDLWISKNKHAVWRTLLKRLVENKVEWKL